MLKRREMGRCIGVSVILAVVLDLFLIAYQNIADLQVKILSFSTLWNLLVSGFSVLTFVIVFLLCFAGSWLLIRYGKAIGAFVYRYRYLFAAAVVFLCVACSISGSSIAQWQHYLPGGNPDAGTLLGMERSIRSDEFAANTPMAFSQYFNHTGAFPYFGDTMRGTSTDMFIVYGQPVLNLMVIFRPFQLGYLLFGPARGLAFFWSVRLVVLFMVSFEFGMLISNRSKSLALSFAVLTAFASGIQWWFAVNGFVEMIVFGELAVLIIYYYLHTSRSAYRFFLTLALVICGGGYILVFYPAWQVSLAYFFLALVIWVFWEGRSRFSTLGKKDIACLLLFLLLLAGAMGYVLFRSGETIGIVLDTAYPGKRVETGGGNGLDLFYYVTSAFLPFSSANMGEHVNAVELSSFLSFFPLGILLSGWVILKEKNRDRLLILLLIVVALLGCYCVIPFPDPLAKLTLLGHSTPDRTRLIFDFVNLVLLIRAAALIKTRCRWWAVLPVAVAYSALAVILNKMALQNYMTKTMSILAFIILLVGVCLLFCLVRSKRNAYGFVLFAVCFSLFAGFSVNPVQQGVDVIYQNPLTQDIAQITNSDHGDGLWLVEGVDYPMINLPVMVGAPTINSTNVYPDLERWELLDPTGASEDIYNRYAHIHVDLQTQEPTSFALLSTDTVELSLNPDDLDTLQVKYILSPNDLTQFNNAEETFELLKQEGDYCIFQVVYLGDVS